MRDRLRDVISKVSSSAQMVAASSEELTASSDESSQSSAQIIKVIDEVRKLAEQSQVSAKHISELIGKIQNDTQSVVQSMNVGTTEVKAGAEAVNNAGTIFRDIYKMIGEVNREIIATQKAVEEMIKASNEADVAVMEIEEISKKTAEGTGTASAATEEQSATIQEVAGASRALAELAQELQKLVNSFKI